MTLPNIILIGPMGAGKSTIGKYLAKALQFDFYDADCEIKKQAGMTIDTIFETEGEAGFRKREEIVIEDLLKHANAVIATGGGAVLSAHNRDILSHQGKIIYLQVSLDKQLTRIQNTIGRPALKKVNISEKLQALQKVREPLYQGLAHHIIKTDTLTPEEIVRYIVKNLTD
jgi:shikimate kinase